MRLVGATTSAGAVQPAGGLLDGDQRQRLHGLAKTHVVCQHPAKADIAQERQPVDALLLIGP